MNLIIRFKNHPTIHHTNVDRAFEHGSFYCVTEGTIVYNYLISEIFSVTENPLPEIEEEEKGE